MHVFPLATKKMEPKKILEGLVLLTKKNYKNVKNWGKLAKKLWLTISNQF